MAGKSLTIGDLLYKLGFENEDQFVASMEKLLDRGEKEAKASGKRAGKGFTDQFKATFSGAAIGSFLGTALAHAFSGALSAARQFAADSVREFAVYEQGLLQLKLAGETNLAALSKRIQQLAKDSKVFSATDISIAVGELVKAGYDAETAFALVEMGALGAASEVDAATGKFGDLTTTSVQLGNILRALGYDTSQSARVMDVLARAAQDSNLNVSDLVDITARVGPTAKLAGLEIEDLAAMAAVLSNNGMDASLIGTGLRSVLQSLINPSANVKEQLDELGISLVDNQGNIRDFNDVLDGLHELTERGGEGLQLLTAATGSYGSTAAASLGAASETVKEFRTSMEGAEGTAQDLADTMRDSAAGAAAELEARVRDAKAELGEQMMPILLDLHETVLPALVTVLGQVIGLWHDWYFILTQTTPEIEQASQALQNVMVDRLGADMAAAVNNIVALRVEIGELEDEIARAPFNYGRSARARDARLAELKADLAAEEAILASLQAARANAQADADAAAERDARYGALRNAPGQPTPAEVVAVGEAYRSLAVIQEELKAATDALNNATGPEEEQRLKTLVARLTAEEEARKRSLGLIRETTAARTVEKDAIAEEVRKITADTRRLKDAFDLELVTRDWYQEQLEAHQRRLWGLLTQAQTPEQRAAVLTALRSNGQVIERMQQETLDNLVAAQKQYQDSRIAAYQAEQDELTAVEEREAARRAGVERVYLDQVVQAWQEYAASRRAAIEGQAAYEEGRAAEAARREELALQAVIQANNEYTDSLRAAYQAEQDRAAARTEREERRELLYLDALVVAHNEYTESLKAAMRLEEEREAAQARRARLESIAQSLGNLFPGAAGNAPGQHVGILERAQGALVRLAEAQRYLGRATRDDVQVALEDQVTSIERLLAVVEVGSERYYELVAALEAARAALQNLAAEIPAIEMPELTDAASVRAAASRAEQTIAGIQAQIAAGPDQATLAMLEQRLAFFQALLQVLRQALGDFEAAAAAGAERDVIEAQAAALAQDLTNIAKSFPLALVDGIRNGDIGGALQDALGNAADYFLDSMLDAILGPITEELTTAIAKSIASKSVEGAVGGLGALGPTGLILGGVALLASLFTGANRQRERQATASQRSVQSAVASAPSITYNLSANVKVEPGGGFGDPAFEAQLRAFVVQTAGDLYRRVRREG